MAAIIDMAGQRHGRLLVLERGPDSSNSARTRRWWCACDCGEHRLVAAPDLRSGHTTSCGCIRRKPDAISRLPEYAIWRGILARCQNPNVGSYAKYGGRGVGVAVEWRRDFRAFLSHVGARPSPSHSIDRIRTDGDYAPGNVRWATPREQVNNRRCTPMVCYRGAELPLADAVRAAGSIVHIETARGRIKNGWNVETALEAPRLHRSGNARPWTGRCAYCAIPLRGSKTHFDHIKPIARGGRNDRRNLQATCAACNLSKGAKDPIDFARSRGGLL